MHEEDLTCALCGYPLRTEDQVARGYCGDHELEDGHDDGAKPAPDGGHDA